jgi:hypothetical protein
MSDILYNGVRICNLTPHVRCVTFYNNYSFYIMLRRGNATAVVLVNLLLLYFNKYY